MPLRTHYLLYTACASALPAALAASARAGKVGGRAVHVPTRATWCTVAERSWRICVRRREEKGEEEKGGGREEEAAMQHLYGHSASLPACFPAAVRACLLHLRVTSVKMLLACCLRISCNAGGLTSPPCRRAAMTAAGVAHEARHQNRSTAARCLRASDRTIRCLHAAATWHPALPLRVALRRVPWRAVLLHLRP